MDSLRETLKVISDGKHTLIGWNDIQISHHLVAETLQILVHEASRWVERFVFQWGIKIINCRNFRQMEKVPGLEVLIFGVSFTRSRLKNLFGWLCLMHLDGFWEPHQSKKQVLPSQQRCYPFSWYSCKRFFDILTGIAPSLGRSYSTSLDVAICDNWCFRSSSSSFSYPPVNHEPKFIRSVLTLSLISSCQIERFELIDVFPNRYQLSNFEKIVSMV